MHLAHLQIVVEEGPELLTLLVAVSLETDLLVKGADHVSDVEVDVAEGDFLVGLQTGFDGIEPCEHALLDFLENLVFVPLDPFDFVLPHRRKRVLPDHFVEVLFAQLKQSLLVDVGQQQSRLGRVAFYDVAEQPVVKLYERLEQPLHEGGLALYPGDSGAFDLEVFQNKQVLERHSGRFVELVLLRGYLVDHGEGRVLKVEVLEGRPLQVFDSLEKQSQHFLDFLAFVLEDLPV